MTHIPESEALHGFLYSQQHFTLIEEHRWVAHFAVTSYTFDWIYLFPLDFISVQSFSSWTTCWCLGTNNWTRFPIQGMHSAQSMQLTRLFFNTFLAHVPFSNYVRVHQHPPSRDSAILHTTKSTSPIQITSVLSLRFLRNTRFASELQLNHSDDHFIHSEIAFWFSSISSCLIQSVTFARWRNRTWYYSIIVDIVSADLRSHGHS